MDLHYLENVHPSLVKARIRVIEIKISFSQHYQEVLTSGYIDVVGCCHQRIKLIDNGK